MDLLRRHRFAACLGFLAGPILTYLGLFMGLQVSSMVGTILAFPFIAMSMLLGKPIGAFSGLAMTLGLLLSCLLWSGIFVLVSWLLSGRR